MNAYEKLEKRINNIENRNQRVEQDKAWETSYTRRILLVIFTYSAVATYLHFVVHIDPWINAIVPSLGFLLSTLTLSFLKKLWGKYIYKK